MNKRCLVLAVLIGLPAIGCQRPFLHAHLELINAEKRALEDELYHLQFEYEAAMREIEELKRQSERSQSEADRTMGDGRPKRSGDSPDRLAVPEVDLSPPIIEEGVPVQPSVEMAPEPGSPERSPQSQPAPRTELQPPATKPAPPVPPQPGTSAPSGLGAAHQPPTPPAARDHEVPTRILALDATDPRVTHLHLDPVHTKGMDVDRQPGDDGIVVVVEPRNRDDVFVPLAGPISVLVLDPTKRADEGRVIARWDVDANEAQRLLKNSASLRGIELQLKWPNNRPPATERLELHVKYLTVDHRDLRAQRELVIRLPGQVSRGWTPRATSRHVAGAPADRARLAAPQSPEPQLPEVPEPPESAEPTESTGPIETARPQWRPFR